MNFSKIHVKESPQKGLGVFASANIEKDEIIEIAPFIEDVCYPKDCLLNKYIFASPYIGKVRVIFGYGSIYNHSNTPNASYKPYNERYYIFTALRRITKDEEICTNYGSAYLFN